MLNTISLENFKSHRQTILQLDDSRLHGIVGQNNSGKTSILQAVHYLSQLADQPGSAVPQNDYSPEYLMTSGQKNTNVSVQGILRDDESKEWVAQSDWEYPENGFWKFRAHWVVDEEVNTVYDRPSTLQCADIITQTVYLKLAANKLAQAAYSDEITPSLESDGSNLAPTLDYLRGESHAAFKKIQEMLRLVVPGVRSIDVRRAKVEVLKQRTIEVDGKTLPYEERREMAGQEIIFNMNGGDRIPAHAISEGTMLTLGFLTVLSSPQKPNLVLLDDIEQGLHPYAQRALVRLLKQILAENHDLQIIFTTHSPYIVDELMPTQVHVLHSTDEGYTMTKRLDEHPDAEWASQSLTTGEFWDAEGESWVEQRPTGV